jgi:GT2 family glycosyltransferase
MPRIIEIVSATRLGRTAFTDTPLGQSLRRIDRDARVVPAVSFDNSNGLSEIYSGRIESSRADILVFVHDDVWIEDFYFTDRVLEGLGTFDVIGVAGNSRRQPQQSAWAYAPGSDRLDLPYLHGAIAHGSGPLGKVGFFGPIVGSCELLDGVFLAAKREALIEHGVRFDTRFAFHFYDLDFCRTARSKGLALGTWPVSMTHRSSGRPFTPAWEQARDAYFAKWGD